VARVPDPAPERVIFGPCSKLKIQKTYRELRDFVKEFKRHWTINNCATYNNEKQLWWQLYETTSNKKANFI